MARTIATVQPEDCEGRPGRLFLTPYSPEWLEEMKATVTDWKDRRFWPDSKGWWIAEEWADRIIELSVGIFGEAEVVDPETGECATLTKEGHIRQEGLLG